MAGRVRAAPRKGTRKAGKLRKGMGRISYRRIPQVSQKKVLQSNIRLQNRQEGRIFINKPRQKAGATHDG
jgi:hypothetical protein